MFQINDSIEHIVSYIETICGFIANLLQTKQGVVPFQTDVCIAVGEPFLRETIVDTKDNDEDDDDDDDDGDNDDDKKTKYEDYVDDFEARIKANNLKYVQHDADNPNFTWREFNALFLKFEKKVNEANDDNKEISYPFRKRFLSFIDRRKDKNNKKIYLYQAPQGRYTRDIPNGYVVCF